MTRPVTHAPRIKPAKLILKILRLKPRERDAHFQIQFLLASTASLSFLFGFVKFFTALFTGFDIALNFARKHSHTFLLLSCEARLRP